MSKISKTWNRFWYDAYKPEDLFKFRILFYTALMFYSLFLDRGNLAWLELPPGFWQPVSILSFLEGPISYQAGYWIQSCFDISCLLCAVGLGFRFFSATCFLSHYILITVTNSYGVALHDDLGITIFLLVLAFSGAHRGYSLDALLFQEEAPKDRSMTWPIRLCQSVFGLVFFMAGYSKIYTSGFAWVLGDTLKNYMVYAYHRDALAPFAEGLAVGPRLAQFPVLCRLLGAIVLILELAGPFINFFKTKISVFLVVLYALMVLGFYFTVTDGFLNLFILFTCWLPLLRQWSENQNSDK